LIGVRPYAARAEEVVARNESTLARTQRMLADHDAAKPPGDDADKMFHWRRERRDIEDRVGAAEEALSFARQAATRAAEQAAAVAADQRHTQAMKLEGVEAKLTLEIAADSEKLAQKLAKIVEVREAIEAANKVRGNRPHIGNGEDKARGRPAYGSSGRYAWDIKLVDMHGLALWPPLPTHLGNS
jgi:hypothetical protein